jgi:hypothetical protein
MTFYRRERERCKWRNYAYYMLRKKCLRELVSKLYIFVKTKNILSLLAITTKYVDEITKNLVKT